MKKKSAFIKILICVALASMSVLFFAGCQSNNSSSTTNQTASTQAQSANRPNAAQMKQRIQDSIKPLVSDGTITQDQADKIVDAMANRPRGNGQNGQNGGQNTAQNNTQSSGQNKQRNNPLTNLVSDGVITQAQADAVMQKVGGGFGNRNHNQASQNSNSQSSN